MPKLLAAFPIAAILILTVLPSSAQLKLEKEILLPNVEGRIDHLSADPAGQRLFVSALENNTLEVVDLKQGRRVRQITGLKEPQGCLYDVNSNRLFIASDGDGTLRSYDAETFTLLKTAQLRDDADNVRYDAQSKQVTVGYGSGGLAAFDTDLNKIWDLKLPSHPESFQFEQKGTLIFVNIPDSRNLTVIDRKQKKVVSEWRNSAAQSNFPMSLDESGKRLFVGYRRPALLVVFDSETGKSIAQFPTVADTDDLFYDPSRRNIYVIGGEGAIEVFHQNDPDHYESLGRVITSSGARTGLFVPGLSRLFVAAPHRATHPARILVYTVE